MARLSPEIQRNFTGGEQSPELEARADIPRWRTALKTLENFVVLIRGLITRRSGFLDIAAAMDAYSVLRPFAFSDSDAYCIEFGVGKARFYRDFGYLETSPASGTPYELVTPFAAGELAALRTAQSADTLFIASGAREVQVMKRNASTDWSIAAADLRNGPFRDENSDTDWTLSTSSTATDIEKGDSISLESSKDLFDAGHVGALFFVRIPDQGAHGLWSNGNTDLTTAARVYWGDNFYVCTGAHGDKTGAQPPVHLLGEAWDGPNSGDNSDARKWAYKHSGWGVLKITAVTDALNATAEALTYIPDELKTGTWRWAEGAFSDYRGWPRMCALADGRLYLMYNDAGPTDGWASVVDDFTNFDGNHPDEATAAFKFRLGGNQGKVNQPRFLNAADRLVIGTSGDEHVLLPADGATIAPGNFKIVAPTAEGAADAEAVRIEDVVFIAADLERVLEFAPDPNGVRQDAYVANDLTLYANHISGGEFAKLAWQREPYRLLWALRGDGEIACCTYRRDQNVIAWHRHPTVKGAALDICTVPSPVKKRQDLWAIVSRSLAAGTVRRIECLMPFFQKGDKAASGAFFVDGGSIYDGSATSTITGLDRFNGESVAVLADGKVVPNITVASGSITLPFAASKVMVGLPITATARTLRCDKDGGAGALSVKYSLTKRVIVDVMDSAGVKAAVGDNRADLLMPSGGGVSGAAAALYSGPLTIETLESDWNDNDLSVICDTPLPATIRAISPPYQVAR